MPSCFKWFVLEKPEELYTGLSATHPPKPPFVHHPPVSSYEHTWALLAQWVVAPIKHIKP